MKAISRIWEYTLDRLLLGANFSFIDHGLSLSEGQVNELRELIEDPTQSVVDLFEKSFADLIGSG